MVAVLPGDATTANHQAFPSSSAVVYIQDFHERVSILSSLQRPRKVTVKGTDGKNYDFLCKPKDDLRKDARLMEFNCIVNKLLQRDPESRRRQLRIRTYAVVPLNEECGILEWVREKWVDGYAKPCSYFITLVVRAIAACGTDRLLR